MERVCPVVCYVRGVGVYECVMYCVYVQRVCMNVLCIVCMCCMSVCLCMCVRGHVCLCYCVCALYACSVCVCPVCAMCCLLGVCITQDPKIDLNNHK